jgi:hypothetical protein
MRFELMEYPECRKGIRLVLLVVNVFTEFQLVLRKIVKGEFGLKILIT